MNSLANATRRKRARALAALFVAAILIVTLAPSGGPTEPRTMACVWCGARATADVILNLVLFIPLGVALAIWLTGWWRPALIGAVLTVGIEAAQLLVPGRDTNVDDILANTLGCILGVALTRTVRLWLAPTAGWRRIMLLAAAVLPIVLILMGGKLLAPSFLEGTYYGQWTADLGNLEWYRGAVVDAHVGNIRTPSRRLRRTDEVRELLYQGAPIKVDAIAGPPVIALAPIFSIYDDREREVMLLGVDRNDAVFRYRMRASDVKLDEPDLRFTNAFRAVKPGASLKLELTRAERGYCLTVNTQHSCKIGLRAGDTWGLLLYSAGMPAWLRELFSLLWIGVLFFPAGLWLSGKREAMAVSALGAIGLALVPFASGLLNTPIHHYAAMLAGIMVGHVAQKLGQRGLRSA